MKRALPLFAITMAACTTPVVVMSPLSAVQEALPEHVASCEFIQTLTATAAAYGVHAASALQENRAALLLSAEKIGATHIVFTGNDLAHGSTSSHGRAFKCRVK